MRRILPLAFVLASLGTVVIPQPSRAATVHNPICTTETVEYNPSNGEDIVVPSGYTKSVFAAGLNFPTAVAFRGDKKKFEVYVLESGHGLPSQNGCNDETSMIVGTESSPTNPFTPDILVFDQDGSVIRGPGGSAGGALAKPSSGPDSLQAHGPAIDIAFENGFKGGRLFATDSNQAIRTAGRPLSWGGETVLCTRKVRFELLDQADCAVKGLTSAGFATIELSGRTGTTVRFR